MITIFLAYSVNGQNNQKKNFKGAIEFAELTKDEIAKVMPIHKERGKAIQAVKKQKLEKAVEKEKIKEIRQATKKKFIAVIGKKKFKKMQKYWAKD